MIAEGWNAKSEGQEMIHNKEQEIQKLQLYGKATNPLFYGSYIASNTVTMPNLLMQALTALKETAR